MQRALPCGRAAFLHLAWLAFDLLDAAHEDAVDEKLVDGVFLVQEWMSAQRRQRRFYAGDFAVEGGLVGDEFGDADRV